MRETKEGRSGGKEAEGGAVNGGDREESEVQPVPPNHPSGTFFQ